MTWTQKVIYRRRVEAGAALLDRYERDALGDKSGRACWPALLDPDRLDLHSQRDDVLGQLFGSYMTGCQAIRDVLDDGEAFVASAAGFTLPVYEQQAGPDMVAARFAVLTEAWRDLVRARLQQR
jgi:hypothetical protein